MWNGTIKKLLRVVTGPKEIFELSDKDIKLLCSEVGINEKVCTNIIINKRYDNIYVLKEYLEKNNICFFSRESNNFPSKLLHLSDCPFILYFKGNKWDFDTLTVAIIGARNCSTYGFQLAQKISFELAANGINVISGMAKGIDSQSHKGAIEAGGITYAVMGCGVDICYPGENIGLYKDIQYNGGIISEFPCKSEPLGWKFPLRNRIISGLSDKIIVVEAKEKSGSLITVDYALKQGKDVYAVPGRIEDNLSRGTNALIKDGAGLIYSMESLLEDLEWDNKKNSKKYKNKNIVLEKDLETLYSCLDLLPKDVEQLICETGKNSVEILRDLIRLEMMGLIFEPSKNHYSKKI